MQTQYDVVILGAGINGVASAKALASKGKSVLVIEKNYIASGASSKSSRLIHGGLRYLEHFELSLVKEALQDQKYLLDNYPDLVKLHPFYFPIYKTSNRPTWMIRIGLWIYGFLSQHGQKISEVSKDKFFLNFKAIKDDELVSVFRYFDAKTNDYDLTHKIAKQAREKGADILENVQLVSLHVNSSSITLETNEGNVQTNVLLNATGAWIDEINEKFNLPSSYTIEKLSGIHIVLGSVLVPEPLILETSSKRIFFIIPEENSTIIGTTERSEKSCIDDIKINNKDVEYLLQESNTYLKTKLQKEDIVDMYIGTRPIIKSKKDPTRMSREYKLDLHRVGENKILNIYGGKLTTFPSLAKKVVNVLTK